MNNFIKNLILTILLGIAFLPTYAQNVSYIQIVHNCPQPSADTVDLYFSGTNQNGAFSVEDSNVVFHSATGMVQILTDDSFTITFTKKHSAGIPSNVYFRQTYTANTLGSNERRAFIFSGVDSAGFSPDPGFSIQQVANLDSVARDTSQVAIKFIQGVTDLPPVKITNLNTGQVYAQTLQYGDASAYDSIRHTIYEFLVTSQDGTINYGTFYSDLSGFSQQPIIIMFSGFLDPAVNDSGQALSLYALLNTGAVYNLPLEISAFQLLQNCADPAADSLDVYINSKLTFHNLGFRNATEAFAFNAHATYDIGIAPKNSSSAADTFWHQVFTFPRDTFFIATASGLLSQTGFAPNPQGISTSFQVLLKVPAQFTASSLFNFDFFMLNGVTDAPPLNLIPTGGPLLLSNVDYTDQTHYVSLPAEFYTLNIQDTSGNTLTSGFANFTAFPAQSGVLLTSGFYNPSANNNGPGMNLYMVPITGGPFIPFFGPQGVDDIVSNTDLQVFPNPASNQLNITCTFTEPQPVTWQIIDINGNIVAQPLTGAILTGAQHLAADLTDISAGIYFSRLITTAGTTNSRFAIVK